MPELDLDDPSDRAFHLVNPFFSLLSKTSVKSKSICHLQKYCSSPPHLLTIHHGLPSFEPLLQVVVRNLPVREALQFTNYPVSESAIYRRIRRYEKRKAMSMEEMSENAAASSLINLSNVDPAFKTPSPPARAMQASRCSTRKRKEPSPTEVNTASINTAAVARAASAELLPKWTVTETTLETMNKRGKRSSQETNRCQFLNNSLKSYRDAKFSDAFKGATRECADIANGPNKGKKGFGIAGVVERWNSSVLSSPNDRLLSKSKVAEALKSGKAGKSPPKRGRPRKIPLELTTSLATHATMKQVSGEGEANRETMVQTTMALTVGTKWENKLKPDYVWRRVRMDHPGLINPSKAKESEDRRIDWLTFWSINEWTDTVKDELIRLRMLKDEPGYIRKYC